MNWGGIRNDILTTGVSTDAACLRAANLSSGVRQAALDAGLVPVIHGDVAFDEERGGTVASTEEIFSYLAREMAPR